MSHTNITFSNTHYWFRPKLLEYRPRSPSPWLKDTLWSGDESELSVSMWRHGSHGGIPNSKKAAVWTKFSMGVEIYSFVKTFFCFHKFAWLVASWVKTLYIDWAKRSAANTDDLNGQRSLGEIKASVKKNRLHHILVVSIRFSVYKLPISSFCGLSLGSTAGGSSQLILISCNEVKSTRCWSHCKKHLKINVETSWKLSKGLARASNFKLLQLLEVMHGFNIVEQLRTRRRKRRVNGQD